ncbi:hypothetical protein Bmyc01_60740 [Bacillus mycoides]|nr:hypothetical protein Bmyc01_60740 [Bacillus mycoides]
MAGSSPGIVPYDQLGVRNPVAFALQYIQQDWVAGLISLGAITGITTVLLVMLYGQTRLFYAKNNQNYRVLLKYLWYHGFLL